MESKENDVQRPSSRKKRVRNFTPTDRAQHRILEKKRREDFNDRMLELAQLLPRIGSVRQLSKHIIVNESIRQIKEERAGRVALVDGVKALIAERDELLQELNRQAESYNPSSSCIRRPRPLDHAVIDMVRDIEADIPPFKGILGNGDGFDEEEDEAEDSDNVATYRSTDESTIHGWGLPPLGNELHNIAHLPSQTPALIDLPLDHAPFLPAASSENINFLFDTSAIDSRPTPAPLDLHTTWPLIADLSFPPHITDNNHINQMPWDTELSGPLDVSYINTPDARNDLDFSLGNIYHTHLPNSLSSITRDQLSTPHLQWLT